MNTPELGSVESDLNVPKHCIDPDFDDFNYTVNKGNVPPKTYLRNYSLPMVPLNADVDESQFPSPKKKSYIYSPKSERSPIPRYLFLSPKKKVKNESAKEALNKYIDQSLGEKEDVKILVKSQLFHKPRSHWTQTEQKLYLKYYLKSPTFYKSMLKSVYAIPSVSTIMRWHSLLKLETGISKNMIYLLMEKGKLMSEMDRKCILLFDGMAIKKELEYDPREDFVQGFNDFGDGKRRMF